MKRRSDSGGDNAGAFVENNIFKKITCYVISLCVFATTMPTSALAQYAGDVATIDPITEIHPILDAIGYQPPAQPYAPDELAYYAFTDEQGRLWDVDVNITRSTAAVRSHSTVLGTTPISDDQTEILANIARMTSSTPDQRLPVDAQTKQVIVMIVIAVVGVAVGAWGLIRDEIAREAQCEQAYFRDVRAYSLAAAQCYANTRTCFTRGGYPYHIAGTFQTNYEGSREMCHGPTGYCVPPAACPT